ncbi:hypothetical protein Bca4012_010347 [Brassica carinata]
MIFFLVHIKNELVSIKALFSSATGGKKFIVNLVLYQEVKDQERRRRSLYIVHDLYILSMWIYNLICTYEYNRVHREI